MVPDGCYEQAFIEAAGAENLEDRCYLTFGGVPPDKQVGMGMEFVQKYQETYGSMPEAYAIYAYEAANVALEAIRSAGRKNRRAIVEAALALENFEGALGTWSFDENGDTDLSRMSGIVVRDGKFEFVKLLGAHRVGIHDGLRDHRLNQLRSWRFVHVGLFFRSYNSHRDGIGYRCQLWSHNRRYCFAAVVGTLLLRRAQSERRLSCV